MPEDPRDTPDAEFSSPACAMHEADDAYMGYASRPELIAFLRTLLAAERARATAPGQHWCAMLGRYLAALGASDAEAAPSRDPGGTFATLRAMLPRVRDDRLHADLRAMLRWYERF